MQPEAGTRLASTFYQHHTNPATKHSVVSTYAQVMRPSS